MIRFWWIRHAPVVGNDDCCYGNNEVECDTSDLESFKSLEKKLPLNSLVFTSPLGRAIKTYKTLNELRILSKNNFIIDPRLAEQNLGDWTGMKYHELTKRTKKLGIFNDNWLMDAKYKPPGGESFIELKGRVNNFLQDILLEHNNKNVIIFSHGGPIRAAIDIALKIKEEQVLPLTIDNTKLSRIDYDKNHRGIIKFINI